MAFEVPLESDRVDDLNLFSTIVRDPLIGTLQWILGGKNKEEENDPDEEPEEAPALVDSSPTGNPRSNNPTMKRSFTKPRGPGLKKAAPSLMGSEISDIGEVRESLDTLCLEHGPESSNSDLPGSFKSKKSLSWSDENGKELLIDKVSCREKELDRAEERTAPWSPRLLDPRGVSWLHLFSCSLRLDVSEGSLRSPSVSESRISSVCRPDGVSALLTRSERHVLIGPESQKGPRQRFGLTPLSFRFPIPPSTKAESEEAKYFPFRTD